LNSEVVKEYTDRIVFKSKIELYLLVIPVLFCLPAFILISVNAQSLIVVLSLLIGLFFFGFLVFKLLNRIKYIIDPKSKKLLIKSVFSTRTIPIANIMEIKNTTSLRGSVAASLDRIEILYSQTSKKSIAISPDNREKFCKTLLAVNEKIKLN